MKKKNKKTEEVAAASIASISQPEKPSAVTFLNKTKLALAEQIAKFKEGAELPDVSIAEQAKAAIAKAGSRDVVKLYEALGGAWIDENGVQHP